MCYRLKVTHWQWVEEISNITKLLCTDENQKGKIAVDLANRLPVNSVRDSTEWIASFVPLSHYGSHSLHVSCIKMSNNFDWFQFFLLANVDIYRFFCCLLKFFLIIIFTLSFTLAVSKRFSLRVKN